MPANHSYLDSAYQLNIEDVRNIEFEESLC